MSDHEQYEILCAMVASGKASAGDLDQLSAHLLECDDCRERLSDYAQVSAQALALHADAHEGPRALRTAPKGMTARFIERATAEGIPLHKPLSLPPGDRLRVGFLPWVMGAAALVVLAGVLIFNRTNSDRTHNPPTEPRSDTAPPMVSHIEPGPALQPATSQPAAGPSAEQPERIAELRAHLSSSEEQVAGLREKIAALELELDRALKASSAKQADLSARLSAIENDNDNLRHQGSAKDARLQDVDRLLKQRESAALEATAALTTKQREVETLRDRLAEREDDVQRERRVVAASAQARDLITARNLHIIDVHDNDRTGRQRPFGRIFYTEGQSLIFYAYDLNAAAGNNAKMTFHVWGGTLGDQRRAKSLGIFRSEDTAAGRWVLTCDDPGVMAQISTVFVTAESATNRLDQPAGKRILFAFLGDRPNHP